MGPDPIYCIAPLVFVIICSVFGLLTLIAKEKWQDKAKTQLFALIAIMGTVGLILWALIYL